MVTRHLKFPLYLTNLISYSCLAFGTGRISQQICQIWMAQWFKGDKKWDIAVAQTLQIHQSMRKWQVCLFPQVSLKMVLMEILLCEAFHMKHTQKQFQVILNVLK